MKLNNSNTAIIKRLLVGRNNRPLRSILAKIEAADLASLFGSLNRRETSLLIDALISINKATPTLLEVPDQQLHDVLRKLELSQKLNIIIYSDIDIAAYFLGLLSAGEQDSILSQIEVSRREKIRHYLSYPEDSSGRMMQAAFSVPMNITAQEALNLIRIQAQSESIYYIYCINERQQLTGVVSLRQLAVAPENKPLEELVRKDVVCVTPDSPAEEAAQLVSHYDLIAIPVVDNERQLLGIVTVDDVLDILQELATANIYAQVGLQEDDRVFTTAVKSIKKRMPWMFLNLFLAALASSVVSLFEETMSHLIILASLKNIVAGMGGNTAIQSLTVVTRGLATGDFNFITHQKAIIKETIVGVVIGVMTGLGAGLLTFLWKGHLMVSIVICLSMIINSFVASIAGAVIPIAIKKYGGDPATGSGVLVTMMTDIFSFFSFLGIATIGLKLFA